MENKPKVRLVEILSIWIPVISLIIALLTWLVPFNSIGPSPFSSIITKSKSSQTQIIPSPTPPTNIQNQTTSSLDKDSFLVSLSKFVRIIIIYYIAASLYFIAFLADLLGKLAGRDFGFVHGLWNYVWHDTTISWFWNRATTLSKILLLGPPGLLLVILGISDAINQSKDQSNV